MPFDRITLASPTGATLSLNVSKPLAPPRAVVMICHGMGEHSARYVAFAEALNAHGFAVFAHDHRGHGLTTAPDAPPMRFAWRGGAERVIEDVLAVRDHAERDYPGLPVILFGHSMGGLIALNVGLKAPQRFAGVAPWNMNAVASPLLVAAARLVLGIEQALKGSDVPSLTLPALTVQMWNKAIPDMKTEADWLSHDPAVIEAVLADPLCGKPATVSMWRDIFDLITGWKPLADQAGAARTLPFFLAGGGEDPSTDHGKALSALAARLEKFGFTSVKKAIYRNSRHETLLDREREQAISDFIGWCDSVLKRQG